MFKFGDVLIISVKSPLGPTNVTFTVIDTLNEQEHIYVLMAQKRIVAAQYMVNNTWRMSASIDLLNFLIPEDAEYHQMIPSEQDLKVQQIADKF